MEWKMEWKFWYRIWKMPNGMEDIKNGMEDNFPYFHTDTNSILDFTHGIYRKIYTIRIVIAKNMWKRLAANHLSTN